jgi:hypothetical protein
VTEQDRYQVRFDWGVTGAAAVADDANIIVWVDVLPVDSPVPLDELPGRAAVIRADLRTAKAAAAWILAEQQRLGSRQTIAVIASGAPRETSWRFAVEDQLAAGAVIDALGELGIDATSPEAAAAESSYRGLARAAGHMLTASVSGRETPPPAGLAKADPDAEVEVLRV